MTFRRLHARTDGMCGNSIRAFADANASNPRRRQNLKPRHISLSAFFWAYLPLAQRYSVTVQICDNAQYHSKDLQHIITRSAGKKWPNCYTKPTYRVQQADGGVIAFDRARSSPGAPPYHTTSRVRFRFSQGKFSKFVCM